MICKDYELLLSAYIDNEVDEVEKKHVEQHLDKCDSCRKKVEDMEKLKNALALEYDKINPSKKSKSKFYRKLYIHFTLIFVGLLICFSVVAFSGGVIQLYYLREMSNLLKFIFFTGVGLILIGLFVLLNDMLINIIRVIKNNNP